MIGLDCWLDWAVSSGSGVVNSDERLFVYGYRDSLKLIDSQIGDGTICALCLGVQLMVPATNIPVRLFRFSL